MSWEFKTNRPIYLQLIEQIELRIFSGIYPRGSRLPSVRDMAKQAAVNPNTMQRALSKLEQDGLIITDRTRGRFITDDKKMIDKAKNRMAQEQVNHFFGNMQKLGFDKKDVIAIINKVLEEMKK
ncbi:MAG: GntR family transcriptional regulator [Thermoanaerobacterales bacterium]|jgi:GntR family transcriptional regulator|nr:GntR family transcriptional regulator [Thermoanaerobacterales bacterium]